MSRPKNNSKPAGHARSRIALLSVLAVSVLVAGACGPSSDDREPELETVDVVAPTIEFEIAEDPQAAPRGADFLGILPNDFPTDFPIHKSSSLVDFGTTEDGWLSVSLLSADPRAKVEVALRDRLRAGGWQLEELAGDGLGFRRGGQRGRLRFGSQKPGTLYHYEYPTAAASRSP